MPNLAHMLEGFASLAGTLTGLPFIVQANMPTKVMDPKLRGRMEFRVIACRPVSSHADEIVYTYDVGLDALHAVSWGLREVTVQVKFMGFDHRFTQDALFYLERLGDRIVWPTSQATLTALGFVLVSRGSFLDLSKVISADDRQGSVGVKDFMFRASVSEEMTGNDSPIGWIQTVQFHSDTLDGEDGEPLATQISGSVTLG